MKIAIVGTSPHKDQAPTPADGWVVWGMNKTHNFPTLQSFTKWFDLHDLDEMYGESDQSVDPGEYMDWLKDKHREVPVVMFPDQIRKHEIPNAEPFHTDILVKQFGTYFSNSVSWMIARAITFQPETIGVYGVDMGQQHEYAWERPSVEFFLGWARGAGIEIDIPKESSLLTTLYLYGVEQTNDMRHVLRRRMESYQQRANSYRSSADTLQGAADEAENLLMIWGLND